MELAETVTFGGSGLDRAAAFRGQAEGSPDQESLVIVLWRGKLLVEWPKSERLVRLHFAHPALVDGRWVFLGLDNKRAIFAVDMSHWQPTEGIDENTSAFFDQSKQMHPALAPRIFCELREVMAYLSPREAELAATAKALFHWHDATKFCARCGNATEMKMSGWERDCPACGVKHFPRTDPVVIMLITSGDDILLGRSHQWPERMYSLLAGFIEPGETLEAAVRREVFEEAGIDVGRVSYLASQPWAFPHSLMLGCQGLALSRDISIDETELEDAIWISKSEIVEAIEDRNHPIQPARYGSIAQFLIKHWLADNLK